MTITNIDAGRVVTVRIFKETDVSPTQVWANTYEMMARSAQTALNAIQMANALVSFERLIHQDVVRFTKFQVSTYVPDGKPYNPESFITKPLTGLGAVPSPASALTLPLQAVLYVKREVESGRYGKLFYRRVLDEGDVEGRYGELNITPASLAAVIDRVADALTTSGCGQYLDGSSIDWQMVLAKGLSGGAPTNIRAVTELAVAGAKLVKYNNRFYNRKAS